MQVSALLNALITDCRKDLLKAELAIPAGLG